MKGLYKLADQLLEKVVGGDPGDTIIFGPSLGLAVGTVWTPVSELPKHLTDDNGLQLATVVEVSGISYAQLALFKPIQGTSGGGGDDYGVIMGDPNIVDGTKLAHF